MKKIFSMTEQCASVRGEDNTQTNKVSDMMKDAEDSWDFRGVVTVKEEAMSNARCNFQKLQGVCKENSKMVPTSAAKATSFDSIELAHVGTES